MNTLREYIVLGKHAVDLTLCISDNQWLQIVNLDVRDHTKSSSKHYDNEAYSAHSQRAFQK